MTVTVTRRGRAASTGGDSGVEIDPKAASAAVASPSPSSTAGPSLRYQALDLSISIGGIYLMYIYYAVLQERLTTVAQADGRKFTYPLFLMLVQCACNSALVWPIMWFKERRAARISAAAAAASVSGGSAHAAVAAPREHGPSSCRMREWQFAALALSYLMGMLSSYEALAFISYPTQVLLKSCKMLPVMLLGAVVFRHKYSAIEYLAVALITLGIWAFFALKDGAPAAVAAAAAAAATASTSAHDSTGTYIGIALSMFSLLCDGITGSGQDHFVSKFHPTSELLMYKMNVWSVIELCVGCFLLTTQGAEGMNFLTAHPSLVGQLLLFGLVSGLGQLFIFHTVTTFGALPLSIATSSRKFFTILLSSILFGHRLNGAQWIAVGAVFAGLGLDIAKKAFNKKRKHKKATRDATATTSADVDVQLHAKKAE